MPNCSRVIRDNDDTNQPGLSGLALMIRRILSARINRAARRDGCENGFPNFVGWAKSFGVSCRVGTARGRFCPRVQTEQRAFAHPTCFQSRQVVPRGGLPQMSGLKHFIVSHSARTYH